MAMNFAQAGRAQLPDYTSAYVKQKEIENQIKQAEIMRRNNYLGAGIQAAELVPEGAWGELGSALFGGGAAGAGEALGASALVNPLTGAVASALPGSTAASTLPAAFTAEAATAAGGAMAEQAALAGATGAAEGGIGAALGGLGPMGWLALLGIGLAATDAFS